MKGSKRRALTFALARLSCFYTDNTALYKSAFMLCSIQKEADVFRWTEIV